MATTKEIARRQNQALDDRSVLLERRVENLAYRDRPDHPYLTEARVRADEIYREFGSSAPAPLRGEDDYSYRLRILDELRQHSPKHRDMPLRALANMPDRAFIHVENEILADAQKAANNWAPPGQLREKVKTDSVTGRRITEYAGGSTLTWMETYMRPKKVFRGFNSNSGLKYRPFIVRGDK
jgi:hypothetical protein